MDEKLDLRNKMLKNLLCINERNCGINEYFKTHLNFMPDSISNNMEEVIIEFENESDDAIEYIKYLFLN